MEKITCPTGYLLFCLLNLGGTNIMLKKFQIEMLKLFEQCNGSWRLLLMINLPRGRDKFVHFHISLYSIRVHSQNFVEVCENFRFTSN